MRARLQSWQQDGTLRRVIRGSGHMFSGNALMALLGMLQGIFIVRLVGMDGLGVVTTVVTLVSNIHRLISFRMSEVVVRHLGAALETQNKSLAASVVRWAVLVEGSTSLLAYAILLAFAPWAARVLVKDDASLTLFWLYGLVLLGNLMYESCVGVLQTLHQFNRLARINMLQSLLTFALVVAAFFLHQCVWMVVLAYIAGKILAGICLIGMAAASMNKELGHHWWLLRSSQPGLNRQLFSFALNTNLQATVNMLVRDNVPLILGALRSQTEVGYFKLALSLINLVMLPIEPFIWPTYTEINRIVALRQWAGARRLLRQVSLIAAAWTAAAGIGIALVGPWLLPIVFGPSALPAYPAMLVLLLGYGFANVFNWNRPLLLAFDQPSFPLITAVLTGVVALGLTFLWVPQHGYLVQAAILSTYFVVSIGIVVWRGLREINLQAQKDLIAVQGSVKA